MNASDFQEFIVVSAHADALPLLLMLLTLQMLAELKARLHFQGLHVQIPAF